jgi:hypothetical protein
MSGVRDYDIEAEEREVRLEQMRADTRLKNVQAAVEWPKTFTAIIVAVATVTGVVAGVAGGIFGYSLHH